MTSHLKTRINNVILATAINATAGAQSLTANPNSNASYFTDYTHRGVRFYVIVNGTTVQGGGMDYLYLCAVHPATDTVVPIAYFNAANMLSTPGTYVFDFFPQAPAGNISNQYGANGVGVNSTNLPRQWTVQVVIGAGNECTIQVEAEMLP